MVLFTFQPNPKINRLSHYQKKTGSKKKSWGGVEKRENASFLRIIWCLFSVQNSLIEITNSMSAYHSLDHFLIVKIFRWYMRLEPLLPSKEFRLVILQKHSNLPLNFANFFSDLPGPSLYAAFVGVFLALFRPRPWGGNL